MLRIRQEGGPDRKSLSIEVIGVGNVPRRWSLRLHASGVFPCMLDVSGEP